MRAMRVGFMSKRIIQPGRFMPLFVSAAFLVAAGSAVVAFPARAVAFQTSAAHALSFTQTITVTTLNDAGPGSLRAAINTANAAPVGDSARIRFGVQGTITLLAPLPAIGREVAIDATTAPTHVIGGPPVVALNFNGNPGLLFAAGSRGSQLRGVAVDNASGNGVT